MKLINETKLSFKKFDHPDIPALIDLSTSIGWDYDRNEITTMMNSGKIYGHKNEEGKIVSSAAIIEYVSKLASVGMVIVRQDYRGMGLGRKATQKCLNSISSNKTAMLIATEEGKPLYEKMGFKSVDYVHKFLCDHYEPLVKSSNHHSNIKPINEEDISQLIHLDTEAFGDNRKTFLINRLKQSKEAIVVKSPEGKNIGYGMSISGPVHLILGPIVALDSETASVIINQLARNHHGKLRIDVPSGQEAFMSHLKKCGFLQVSQPPIMIKNGDQLPLRNNTLYGISAQAFG